MSKRKNQQVVTALDSAEAYGRAVASSEKFLVVVDIHQGWCGPVTAMCVFRFTCARARSSTRTHIVLITARGALGRVTGAALELWRHR